MLSRSSRAQPIKGTAKIQRESERIPASLAKGLHSSPVIHGARGGLWLLQMCLYFLCKTQALELYLFTAVPGWRVRCSGILHCRGEGGSLGVWALKQYCVTPSGPASPRCRQAGGVPQCTRTQRTFKENLLESALAMDLSREIASAITSAKASVQ